MSKSCRLVLALFLLLASCTAGYAAQEPPAGLGLMITSDKSNHYSVQYVLPNMPGAQANIKVGDEVRAVDGVPVDKIHNLDELVARIRGEKGTTVKLKIATKGVERELTLTRGEIPETKSPQRSTMNFGREAAVHFWLREDLIEPSTEAGPLGDHSVRNFLKSNLNQGF